MKQQLFVPYYRVSTEKQRNAKNLTKQQIKELEAINTGLGLASQREIVRGYIQANNGILLKEFEEIQSATQKEVIKFGKDVSLNSLLNKRKGLLEALNYAREHNATLIVSNSSRLTRFKLLGEYLMATKVKFLCADSPSDNNFIIGIKIATHQDEAETTSKRTSNALQIKLKRTGKWQTPNPDYVSGKLAAKAREILIKNSYSNENNVRAADCISMKVREGLSFPLIADHLNQNKYKTSRGKSFTTTQVQRIYKKFCCKIPSDLAA